VGAFIEDHYTHPDGRRKGGVSVHHFGVGVVDFVGFAVEIGLNTRFTKRLFLFPSLHAALVERADQAACVGEMLGPLLAEPLVELDRLVHPVDAGGVVCGVVVQMARHSCVATFLLSFEPRIAATDENNGNAADSGPKDKFEG